MVNNNKVLRFIATNLDSILASVGAIFALVLTVWLQINIGRPIVIATGALSFLACITYLVLKYRQKLAPISSILELPAKPYISLLTDTLFFAFFAYSLWDLALRPETYVRPLGYFVSVAAMSAVLAVKILFLPSKTSSTVPTLIQIILMALSLEWSLLLLYPSIVGADPWYHQLVTLEILDKASASHAYSGLATMHLAIGATSLIGGLDYKMATMLSICLLQVVCDVLFVFLIGRLLFNYKIGLLAALLIGTANWHIFFGYWTIPNTLGATFVVIIIYLLLKFHKERTNLVIPVCALLMIALLLTHVIASFWLSALLFTFWLSAIVYNKLLNQKLATLAPLVIALVFTITLLSWWTFGLGWAPEIGATHLLGMAPTKFIPPVRETLSDAPFSEFLFNSLGMFLFFTLSFIGCFYMLSGQFGNPYALFLAAAGVFILSIGYFPMLSGISVIEHRWWYLAEILLSVPLALALCILSGLLKKRKMRATAMAISVSILTFLMIMGLPSNMDNRTFSPNQLVRYAFTESELQALRTASTNSNGIIGVDGYYIAAGATPGLLPNPQYKLENISPCLLVMDFNTCHTDMLLIRDEVVIHPIGTGAGTIFRLNYDPRQLLAEQGLNKVYDCSSVSGFTP